MSTIFSQKSKLPIPAMVKILRTLK